MHTFKSANINKELGAGVFKQYETGDKMSLEGILRTVNRKTIFEGKERNESFIIPVWYNVV